MASVLDDESHVCVSCEIHSQLDLSDCTHIYSIHREAPKSAIASSIVNCQTCPPLKYREHDRRRISLASLINLLALKIKEQKEKEKKGGLTIRTVNKDP
jgi:hypothetical protein